MKEDLIRYRMGRAREALTDADAALREERWNGASNRIYYAMFYATTALLATRDLSSSRHSGVISLLHEHFVRLGTFPRPLAHQLASAFDMRAESDYKDFAEPDPVRLREMLEQAGTFIEAVEKLLPSQSSTRPNRVEFLALFLPILDLSFLNLNLNLSLNLDLNLCLSSESVSICGICG